MREIVLDTETTGLRPQDGDRIVEIGCVELVSLLPTGRTWHAYINPDRPVPEEAARVHGLRDDFLADKPVFAAIAEDFLAFIGDDVPLVIHNAPFDVGFLNHEMKMLGLPRLTPTRIVDTLDMARKSLPPGTSASLDSLCRRFKVDLSERKLHGALLDAQLLAAVYLALRGGREPDLAMDTTHEGGEFLTEAAPVAGRVHRVPRPHAPTEEEQEAHEAFLATLRARS